MALTVHRQVTLGLHIVDVVIDALSVRIRRTPLTHVLRGKPNTVTSAMDFSRPLPGRDLQGKRHFANSSLPGARANCSAWARRLGKAGRLRLSPTAHNLTQRAA